MKKYLKISALDSDFKQEIMLSEARMISKICLMEGDVLVELIECTEQEYKVIFG